MKVLTGMTGLQLRAYQHYWGLSWSLNALVTGIRGKNTGTFSTGSRARVWHSSWLSWGAVGGAGAVAAALIHSSYWNSRWVNSCCSCKVIQKIRSLSKRPVADVTFLGGALVPWGNVNRQRHNSCWGSSRGVSADPTGPRVTRLLCPGEALRWHLHPSVSWAGTSGGVGCFQRTWKCPALLWVTHTEWLLQSSTCSPAQFLFCHQEWQEEWSPLRVLCCSVSAKSVPVLLLCWQELSPGCMCCTGALGRSCHRRSLAHFRQMLWP